MGFGVALKQANFVSSWTLGLQASLEILELFAVELGVYCGVNRRKLEVDDALKIPTD